MSFKLLSSRINPVPPCRSAATHQQSQAPSTMAQKVAPPLPPDASGRVLEARQGLVKSGVPAASAEAMSQHSHPIYLTKYDLAVLGQKLDMVDSRLDNLDKRVKFQAYGLFVLAVAKMAGALITDLR